MRPTPKLSQEEELEAFLADQNKRQAVLNTELEKKRIQEVRSAEAEIEANLEREAKEKARQDEFIKAKNRVMFSLDLGLTICRRIAHGEMLKAICEEQSMPHMETVQDWLEEPRYSAFKAAFLRACDRRDQVFEDEIILIADDSRNDYMDKTNSRTGETFRTLDPESIARSKLRIEMRLKLMKANNPAKWGDGVSNVNNSGALLDRPPVVSFNFYEAAKVTHNPGDNAKIIEQAREPQVVTLEQLKEKVA